ncbi:MAG TPA: DUF4347 domain-containing protein [Rudaea sp.]|nr:DUF4347 domain-containing protein [Rudaea sp.]
MLRLRRTALAVAITTVLSGLSAPATAIDAPENPVVFAAPTTEPLGPAVLFIDSRVRDARTLLRGITAGTEIVTLDAKRDGLLQMADFLAQHREVSSVEIVAHGNAAELLLGSTDLTTANIASYAQTLGAIGDRMKRGGDILVYACNTAAGERGVRFVDTLAALTGHHVAASARVVGKGGGWDLAVATGDISAAPVLSRQAEASYGHSLSAPINVSTLDALNSAIASNSTGDVTIDITSNIAFTSGDHPTIAVSHSGGTLTIDGGGNTIDAAWLNRAVTVSSGSTVILENLTIEHGLVSGTGGNGSASGGSGMGAGISNAGNLTLNNVTVTQNYATGGGGGGSGSAGGNIGFAGGGGSGAHGIGGASSGVSFPATYGAVAGGSGSGGTGGSFSGNYGGKGGSSSGGGAGGQNDGGFYAGGGNGGTASGTTKIGGGGGGASGEANGSGGNGGNAAGGIYNSGTLYVIGTSAITHNYGAGGGGGGACGGGSIGGSGGLGVGGIWNKSTATLKMTAAAYSTMGSTNHGGNGHGGYSYGGSTNGSTPGSTFNNINTGSGTIITNYLPAPTVTSVNVPANGTYHSGQALQFTVNFSTPVTVTGTPELAITLDTGGTVEATYQSGSGSSALLFSYTVLPGQQDTTGITVGALTLNGGTIKDSSNNAATLTLNNVGSTSGVDVQAILPTVSAINIAGSSPTNASSESYTVTYSEAMNPSTVLNTNFTPTTISGSLSYTGIVVSEVSTSVYTVTVNGVSGSGVQRLDLNPGSGEQDIYGNTIGSGHTGNQTYTIDQTPPAVTTVSAPVNATYIAGQNLDFTVNFTKAATVTGTPEIPLTLDTGGTVYAQYRAGSGSTALAFRYTVAAGESDPNGITVGGSIVPNGGTIVDAVGNAANLSLNGVADTSGVLVDSIPPTVASIAPDGTSPTNASSLDFTVTFSESVTGVDPTDFTLTATGSAAGLVSSVSGGGAVYTVTVTNVSGDGTLRLDLNPSGTGISDLATNPIQGGFTAGQTYTVDHTPPSVVSILPASAPQTHASTLAYTVTFSETVTGVDVSDFSLAASGNVAGMVSSVNGSGAVYTVTVSNVTGDGTLRLDLKASGTGIVDLATNPIQGGFTGGQSYTITHLPQATIVSGLGGPRGVAIDAAGNLYVSDVGVSHVTKYAPAGSGSYALAGTVADSTTLLHPFGVAVDASGNVFVADSGNNLVRKFSSGGGSYTDTADIGAGLLNSPYGVSVDAAGNVYIADTGNFAVRKYAPNGGSYTLQPDVTSGSTYANYPYAVAADNAGDVFIADTLNWYVRQFVLSAGSYPAAPNASISLPSSSNFRGISGVAVDTNRNVYAADRDTELVYGSIPLGGGGYGSADDLGVVGLGDPWAVTTDKAGNVYVTDIANGTVIRIGDTVFKDGFE